MSRSKKQRRASREERIEIHFLEGLRRRTPQDEELLKVLGDLYTRVGEFEKGLEVDHVLSGLCPDDPGVWYNLGCSLSLLGRIEEALETLRRAVELGWSDRQHLLDDADLEPVRTHPDFRELLRKCTA